MGSAPDWYPTVVAARWAHLEPWALDEAPIVWQSRILAAMAAEAHAKEMQKQ